MEASLAHRLVVELDEWRPLSDGQVWVGSVLGAVHLVKVLHAKIADRLNIPTVCFIAFLPSEKGK